MWFNSLSISLFYLFLSPFEYFVTFAASLHPVKSFSCIQTEADDIGRFRIHMKAVAALTSPQFDYVQVDNRPAFFTKNIELDMIQKFLATKIDSCNFKL